MFSNRLIGALVIGHWEFENVFALQGLKNLEGLNCFPNPSPWGGREGLTSRSAYR